MIFTVLALLWGSSWFDVYLWWCTYPNDAVHDCCLLRVGTNLCSDQGVKHVLFKECYLWTCFIFSLMICVLYYTAMLNQPVGTTSERIGF